MSIIDDVARMRAVALRMRSNADQFAEAGNPWSMSAEERVEISTKTSRKLRRNEAKLAREKPEFVERPRKIPLSEKALAMREQREILKVMLSAGTGNPSSRTLSAASEQERHSFLRYNTDANFSERTFVPAEGQLRKSLDQSLAEHADFVRRERDRMAEARASAKRDAKGRVADRNLWPIV